MVLAFSPLTVSGGARFIRADETGPTGTVYLGKPVYAARSLDTDDLDLYLLQQAILAADGRSVPPRGVAGVLVPRSQISVISVFSREKAA